MEVIVDTLCNNMIGDKEQLRDISSIGLKTVINELPLTTQTLAATVCKTIVGRLSSAISQQEDVGVQLEALDILGKNLFQFIIRHFCLLNHKKIDSSPKTLLKLHTLFCHFHPKYEFYGQIESYFTNQ